MRHFGILSLVALIAASSLAMAQSESDLVFRQQLTAPVFLSGGSTTPPPPVDPNFPGDEDPVPVTLSLSPGLPLYATANETYYSGFISATGADAETVTLTQDGDWPLGLLLSGSDLFGTFTAPDEYGPFWVRGSDGSSLGPYSISVESALSQAALPASWLVQTDTRSTMTIPATTGGKAPYTYTFTAPANSAVLADIDEETNSIVVTTPVASGAYGDFVLTAEDARGRTASSTISVTGTAPLALSNVNPSYNIFAGASFTIDALLTGGSGSYSLALEGADPLPPGLTITDSAAGIISGIPTEPGIYAFTLRFSDGSDDIIHAATITVAAPLMPTYVTSGTFSTTSGSSISMPVPAGAQVGDLVVILAQQGGTGVPSIGSSSAISANSSGGFNVAYARITNLSQTFAITPSAPLARTTALVFRNAGTPILDSAGTRALTVTSAGASLSASVAGAGIRTFFSGRFHTGDWRGDRYTFSDPQGNFPTGLTEITDSSNYSSGAGATVGIGVAYGPRAIIATPTNPVIVVKTTGANYLAYFASVLIPYAAN